MARTRAFVAAVQMAAQIKQGWTPPLASVASVLVASRLREEDVPSGSPEDVAERAFELVEYMTMRVRLPASAQFERPEWLPSYAVESKSSGDLAA